MASPPLLARGVTRVPVSKVKDNYKWKHRQQLLLEALMTSCELESDSDQRRLEVS